MTLEETRKVLHTIKIAYPMAFRNMTMAQMNEYLELWWHAFAEDDAKTVMAVTGDYIKKNKTGFPPDIGKLKQAMAQIPGYMLPGYGYPEIEEDNEPISPDDPLLLEVKRLQQEMAEEWGKNEEELKEIRERRRREREHTDAEKEDTAKQAQKKPI